MTIADYEKALTRRDQARKGGEAYQSVAQYDATLMAVFLKSGLGGVKPSDTSEDIKDNPKKQIAFMQFWDAVDQARSATQLATGKKVDDVTTREMANKTALMLNQKVKFTIPGAEFTPPSPYSERKFGDLTPDEMNRAVFEMPRDFTQALYSFAKARPGTIPQGQDFEQWGERNRGAINRAYFAFLAGASEAEIRVAYLGGK